MTKYKKYGDYRRQRRRRNRLLDVLVLIVAVLLVLCAYAGKISADTLIAAPFLTLAYMPMLVVAALALLTALLGRRWLAALALVVAFVATSPVYGVYVPLNDSGDRPAMPVDSSRVLKVMTYNALAFNYNDPELGTQPSASMRLILEAGPDVVLLQEGSPGGVDWDEVPSVVPYLDQVRSRYPYRYQGDEGLNILSRYPFTMTPIGDARYNRSPLGYNRAQVSRLARAFDLQLPGGKQLRLVDFRLQSYHLSFGKGMSVRVSPDVKPAPLERMRRSFSLRDSDALTLRRAIDASPANVIVCGDMNDVPTSHAYRQIMGDDLTDAWREVGRGYAYTFNRHHLPFRIDHVFYRGNLRAVAAERLQGGYSDHYPLMVTFDLDFTDK